MEKGGFSAFQEIYVTSPYCRHVPVRLEGFKDLGLLVIFHAEITAKRLYIYFSGDFDHFAAIHMQKFGFSACLISCRFEMNAHKVQEELCGDPFHANKFQLV